MRMLNVGSGRPMASCRGTMRPDRRQLRQRPVAPIRALATPATHVRRGPGEPAAEFGQRERERRRARIAAPAAPQSRQEVATRVPPRAPERIALAVIDETAQEEAGRSHAVAAELPCERRVIETVPM